MSMTERMKSLFTRAALQLWLRPERGANLVEYALLLALIVVACLAAVTTFGQTVPAEGFDSVSSTI